MSKIIEVKDQKELDKALSKNNKVVLNFWAHWSRPCRMIAPVLNEIDSEDNGITVIKVNTDESPDLAEAYGIKSVPTFKIFVDAIVTQQLVGACSKERLLEAFVPVKGES